MIRLEHVSDHVVARTSDLDILHDATCEIPAGRYALLVESAVMRPPAVDLLCGTRPPRVGRIIRDGRTSWAIGRTSLFRGSVSGYDLIAMFARIYDLDRSMIEGFIAELVDGSEMLEEPAEAWTPVFRAQVAQAMALLPRFDIYVTDGNVLFSRDRFGAMWQLLFERRTAGRTLIISSLHLTNYSTFCENALILADGKLTVSDDLDAALALYPPRQDAASEAKQRQAVVDDDPDETAAL